MLFLKWKCSQFTASYLLLKWFWVALTWVVFNRKNMKHWKKMINLPQYCNSAKANDAKKDGLCEYCLKGPQRLKKKKKPQNPQIRWLNNNNKSTVQQAPLQMLSLVFQHEVSQCFSLSDCFFSLLLAVRRSLPHALSMEWRGTESTVSFCAQVVSKVYLSFQIEAVKQVGAARRDVKDRI